MTDAHEQDVEPDDEQEWTDAAYEEVWRAFVGERTYEAALGELVVILVDADLLHLDDDEPEEVPT